MPGILLPRHALSCLDFGILSVSRGLCPSRPAPHRVRPLSSGVRTSSRSVDLERDLLLARSKVAGELPEGRVCRGERLLSGGDCRLQVTLAPGVRSTPTAVDRHLEAGAIDTRMDLACDGRTSLISDSPL